MRLDETSQKWGVSVYNNYKKEIMKTITFSKQVVLTQVATINNMKSLRAKGDTIVFTSEEAEEYVDLIRKLEFVQRVAKSSNYVFIYIKEGFTFEQTEKDIAIYAKSSSAAMKIEEMKPRTEVRHTGLELNKR